MQAFLLSFASACLLEASSSYQEPDLGGFLEGRDRQESTGTKAFNIHEVIKMQPCPTRPHRCYQTDIDNFFELNSMMYGGT